MLLDTDLKLMEILALHLEMARRLSSDDLTVLKCKSLKNSPDLVEEECCLRYNFKMSVNWLAFSN